MIEFIVSDPDGDTLRIKREGVGAHYLPPPIPASGTQNKQRFFSQHLSNDGTVTGITDMSVDGSTTAADFFISSSTKYDIYITMIVIVIADTTVSHNSFGNLPALTNGFDLSIFESGEETFLINAAKTGGQVLAQSGLVIPYGNSANVNELTNWTGNTDAQTITIPVSRYVPGGLRLGRGNQDKLTACINDNLTGLTEFTCLALGNRVYP